MPRRIFRSLAYQLAQDPESLVTIAFSGNRADTSHATRFGLTGSAGCIARSPKSFHQAATYFSISPRHFRSCFR
jgi:hypothetical protein